MITKYTLSKFLFILSFSPILPTYSKLFLLEKDWWILHWNSPILWAKPPSTHFFFINSFDLGLWFWFLKLNWSNLKCYSCKFLSRSTSGDCWSSSFIMWSLDNCCCLIHWANLFLVPLMLISQKVGGIFVLNWIKTHKVFVKKCEQEFSL